MIELTKIGMHGGLDGFEGKICILGKITAVYESKIEDKIYTNINVISEGFSTSYIIEESYDRVLRLIEKDK